jgi:hypothetical protein
MKKILVNLLALSVLTTGVVACGSGGSSSVNNAPAAPVVDPIQVPANFIPFGSVPGAGSGSTTPVAYDQASGQIAVPVNGVYTQYTLPTTVNNALSAAFTSGDQNTTQVSVSGSNVILQIPSTTPGAEPTIFVLTPVGSSAPSLIAVGGTNSSQASVIELAVATSYESSGVQSTQFGLSSGMTPSTNIIVNPNIPVTQFANVKSLQAASTSIPLNSNVCTGYSGTPSALQIADYNGTTYVGAGSTTGQVCVLTVAKPVILDSTWTSLTSGSGTAGSTNRYTPGNVNQFNFYQGNPAALFGYWNVKNTPGTQSGTNQIYRVTNSPSNLTAPTSFWNITTAEKQTSSTFASSVQFTNVPTSVNSMYTDSNGNMYVGTISGGSVYKLAPGNTQWTATQLTSTYETGPMTLSPTTTGSGAIATIYNSSTGSTAVYTVN